MYFERIKTIRQERKIKQLEVINFLGIDPSTYKRYESGKRELPIHLLKKLCEYYNVSADYILEITDEQKPIKE